MKIYFMIMVLAILIFSAYFLLAEQPKYTQLDLIYEAQQEGK